MNPAIHAAIIAAAHDEETRDKIEKQLRTAKALSAPSAIELNLSNDEERESLEEALANGTIVRTSDGRIYLNERAAADRKEERGFAALIVLLIVASLIASGVALAIFTGANH